VRREVEEWIVRESGAADDWLREQPPSFEGWPNAVMPMEISESEPIVLVLAAAGADVGRFGGLGGLDSWHDGATLTVMGGIPSVAYGPPGFAAGGVSVAHTIDEYVPVDGLVGCAQGLAVAALRYCGVA